MGILFLYHTRIMNSSSEESGVESQSRVTSPPSRASTLDTGPEGQMYKYIFLEVLIESRKNDNTFNNIFSLVI